ncbi:MAG TPA: hypothetical protein VNC50_03530, partial [Planctomycetia bacterium]|nr:hypothetical protein [Planctomycetia bacterium]
EVLRPIVASDADYLPPCDPPQYEAFGRARVLAGRYVETLEYRRHMLPLAERLRRFAGSDRSAA